MMKRTIQFTGLSGVGKTTLSLLLQETLLAQGYSVVLFDGDELRKSLSADLGFSKQDRLTHLQRVADLAASTVADFVLIAVINPYEESRFYFKQQCNANLIWLRCNLEVLKKRDTKGLYQKACLPEQHPHKLNNLTGVNDPYEEPNDADLIIDTDKEPKEASVLKIANYLKIID